MRVTLLTLLFDGCYSCDQYGKKEKKKEKKCVSLYQQRCQLNPLRNEEVDG